MAELNFSLNKEIKKLLKHWETSLFPYLYITYVTYSFLSLFLFFCKIFCPAIYKTQVCYDSRENYHRRIVRKTTSIYIQVCVLFCVVVAVLFVLDILLLRFDHLMVRFSSTHVSLFIFLFVLFCFLCITSKTTFSKTELKEFLVSLWLVEFSWKTWLFVCNPSEAEAVFPVVCVSGVWVSGKSIERMIHITQANCCDRLKLDINGWCNRKIHNPDLISHQPRATE